MLYLAAAKTRESTYFETVYAYARRGLVFYFVESFFFSLARMICELT